MSNIWWESEQFIELPRFKDASLGFINSPLAQVNVFTNFSRDFIRYTLLYIDRGVYMGKYIQGVPKKSVISL